MADVVNSAYAVIFVGVLLLIGVLVFGTVADVQSDSLHTFELLGQNCTDSNNSAEITSCFFVVDNPPIENVTRAIPVVLNCTDTAVVRADCQTLTAGTHFKYNVKNGSIDIYLGAAIPDAYNGSIYVDYWEDEVKDTVDRAQQSITGTVYGGFDLATVMVIVMAAVAIISTIFLIGRREG